MPWHVMYSRVGIEPVLTALFLVLMLWAFWWALRTDRRLACSDAGVAVPVALVRVRHLPAVVLRVEHAVVVEGEQRRAPAAVQQAGLERPRCRVVEDEQVVDLGRQVDAPLADEDMQILAGELPPLSLPVLNKCDLPQRLEAEALRDSMLAVSGQLNAAMFGPAMYPRIPDAAGRVRACSYSPRRLT